MRTEEFISKAKDLGWGINKTASTIELVELTFPADGAMASISEVTRNLFETHYYDVVSVDDETLDLIVAYTRTPIEDRKEPENKHFVKDTKGEIIMTFNEALRLLLKGKRMCVPGWNKNHYIRLADSADAGVGIVTECGNTYEMYASDYHYNWKVFDDSYKVGDLLAYEDKVYRIIKHCGKYGLVNTKTWVVLADSIDEKDLGEVISEYDLVKF